MLRALVGLFGLVATSAHAQSVEQFYRRRTINLIVGFNPGGAYDPYARAVARYLPKYLPGAPSIIIKNMPGAGSVMAANHLYNVSPRDGSEIGVIAGSAAIQPLFGARATQFDGQKLTWLGSANEEIGGCFAWHTTPFHSAKDLFDKEMIIGASGASNLEYPTVLNAVLGTKMKVVRGYSGPGTIMLAIERGEVQGMCGSVLTFVNAQHPDWVRDNKVRMLIQIGLQRSALMGDTPFVMDFAKTEDDKRMLRVLIGWNIMGRPFLAPPDIPADRRAALIVAFDAAMQDPEFRADAARQRLEVSSIGGAQIDSFLADVYATPKPLVERAGKILAQSQSQ
jgi:tripartite-type tricarboxylate transporter receptor subunit TctC